MVTENATCAAAVVGNASAPRAKDIASSNAAIGVLIIEFRSLGEEGWQCFAQLCPSIPDDATLAMNPSKPRFRPPHSRRHGRNWKPWDRERAGGGQPELTPARGCAGKASRAPGEHDGGAQ